jgi:hypothetical protein
MTRRPTPILALLATLTTACAAGSDGDDSIAGLPAWTLSPEPILTLADDGSVARGFARALPARLPNGDLLLADVSSKELRVLRDGALVTRLSRQGDGPGELQDLSRIAVAGDTIVVIPLPMVSRHVSTYSAATGFLSRVRLRPAPGAPGFTPVGRLRSGEFLVEEGRGFRAINEVPPMGVLLPDSATIGLFRPGPDDSTGTMIPIGRFRRWHRVAHPVKDLPIPFSMALFSIGPTTAWTASGSLLWIADAETGVVRAFDGAGTQVVIDTLPIPAQPFDDAALQRAREAELAAAQNETQRAGVEAVYDPSLRPATMPRFDAILAGHDGELWVRLYRPDPGPTRDYLVVSRSGQAVARVSVPSELVIHQVGADFILGVRRDADGVETVVEYRLTRGG